MESDNKSLLREYINKCAKEMILSLKEEEVISFSNKLHALNLDIDANFEIDKIEDLEPMFLPFDSSCHKEQKDIDENKDFSCFFFNKGSKSLLDLHDAIISGEATPLELVKEALAKIKANKDNAFEYVCEQEAYKQVEELKNKPKDSIFYGVPIAVKDNYYTKNVPTTASSDMLEGFVPDYSAEVVDCLVDAGAIIIGKTCLDELAMGGKGENGHKGPTFNPWDKLHEHIIGGSSSGSAAAVSAGIVPFALGSDTGDSVRKPASYAGLVGLKPTWDLLSRKGLLTFASSMDTVGFFARNVTDSAISLSLLAKNDYLSYIDKPISDRKVAVIKQIVDEIKDEEVLSSFDNVINILSSSGVKIDLIDLDEKLLKSIHPTYSIISSYEASKNLLSLDGVNFGNSVPGNTIEKTKINSRTKGLSSLVKSKFVFGYYVSTNKLLLIAQKYRRLIANIFNKVLSEYDAIILPATPSKAPRFKNKESNLIVNNIEFHDF